MTELLKLSCGMTSVIHLIGQGACWRRELSQIQLGVMKLCYGVASVMAQKRKGTSSTSTLDLDKSNLN